RRRAGRPAQARSRSRWRTRESKPRSSRTRESSFAITTLRWRPPVQPTPMERYALPSCTYAGSSSANSRPSSSRNAFASGWSITYCRTRESVPGTGRSSSIQWGFGRKRQSKRRSTSTGMPCLYPNDTMLVCSAATVGASSLKSSWRRSRSAWTLSIEVSTTRAAWPLSASRSSRRRRGNAEAGLTFAPPEELSLAGDAVDDALGVRERVAAPGLLESADEHVGGGVGEHERREQPLGMRVAQRDD